MWTQNVLSVFRRSLRQSINAKEPSACLRFPKPITGEEHSRLSATQKTNNPITPLSTTDAADSSIIGKASTWTRATRFTGRADIVPMSAVIQDYYIQKP